MLITGWASFVHGEATAGDVRSMERVAAELTADGIPHDVVWSPKFRADGQPFAGTSDAEYTHVVFACGPLHGWQIEELHHRFAGLHRIAVGTSVVTSDCPAAAGFDRILARDGPGLPARKDLATQAGEGRSPVVGVVLAPGQPEFGDRRRHEQVHEVLRDWLVDQEAAPLPLDTRLDTADWQRCSTADEFACLIARTDLVITTRLHGIVFALCEGVPALAIDPVEGGGKVTAQTAAWQWPAVISAEELAGPRPRQVLDRWWTWCRSDEARELAIACERSAAGGSPLLPELAACLRKAGQRARS
ncbi:polysaccharide pyruvyl transferase family protein [Parasphingorhabdus pacifica]